MLRLLLRGVAVVCFVAAFALIVATIVQGEVSSVLRSWLVTCVGVAISSALSDFLVGALAERPRLRNLGLAACAVSIVAFVLLVWGWATEPVLWRVWWISGLGSLLVGHIGRLGMLRVGRDDVVERWTPRVSVLSGSMLIALALRPPASLIGPPHDVYLWTMIGACVLTGIGSWIHWQRHVKDKIALDAVLARSRPAITAGVVLLAFTAGHYVGRVSAPPPTPLEGFPSALRGMAPAQVQAQTEADLARLKTIVAGIGNLTAIAESNRVDLTTRMKAEGRTRYTPAEEERMRRFFVSYLAYRTALLRLAAAYAGFETVTDSRLRARCFLVGYAAGMTVYSQSLRLINTYWEDEALRRKLNEPEVRWNIRAGTLDMLYQRVTSERNRDLAAELGAYYAVRAEHWRSEGVWSSADHDWLEEQIATGSAYVKAHSVQRARAWLEVLMARVRDDAYSPVYAAQSLVSEWLGDTRVVEQAPLISLQQITATAPKLQPGDIILERRNWFLSNAFLPGFWPHSALYIGTHEDLKRLGIADRPEVKRHLEKYLLPGEHGHPRTIIEAVSEGVIFNTLEHSLHADYVAVLRPRLTDAQKAEAIVRAFTHIGKPYDFEFDFATSDKLVCTELVYRSYAGLLDIPLVQLMGRETLPALEIARLFAARRGTDKQQLDFVLFLDGDARKGRASLADIDIFCKSVHRPQEFHR